MGKNDDWLALLLAGALILGIAGFFTKPKCPVCKLELPNKPQFCPNCRTPLKWNSG